MSFMEVDRAGDDRFCFVYQLHHARAGQTVIKLLVDQSLCLLTTRVTANTSIMILVVLICEFSMQQKT